jgi:diguanylate cyclase (GGDEF)-like protein
MLSSLTPTEVSFLAAAVIQAMACAVWALAAWAVPETRRAMLHWAAWAGLSSITWVVLAARVNSPPLAGIVAAVLGASALQRGIRIHIGRRLVSLWLPAALVAAVVAADALGADSAHPNFPVVVNFSVMAGLYLGMSFDLQAHGRNALRLRWPWLLALPVLLGALVFASRALRAGVWPESVPAVMATDSALNVGSALSYVVLVLTLHAMLLALVMGRLLTDLRRLARHDALTGLLNRRALEEALTVQVQRSRRNSEPFCVLMIDVDHFKEVNDRFGHAVGDAALQQLSTTLLGHMRVVDRLGRFGGEEFLVLLPGLTLAAALPVAERLRQVVAAQPLVNADAAIALSVSVGVAEWGGAQEQPSRLLVRADAALYQAKQRGRDQVAWSGAEPRPA